jgi:hypothetical protein
MKGLRGILLANEDVDDDDAYEPNHGPAYENLKESVDNLIENIREIGGDADLDEVDALDKVMDALDSFEEFIS